MSSTPRVLSDITKDAAMDGEDIHILLIEDNPADVRLIREMLADIPGAGFDLACGERLSTGLKRLAEGGIDAILLDLSLPDSQGLDTFRRVREQTSEAPIIVLSGLQDEDMAAQTVREGAQDYLVKGQVDANLLGRSIRYAVERRRLLAELEQERLRQQQEKEILSLERFSSASQTSVTAKTFGFGPVRENAPEVFGEWVERYGKLMAQAVEQRIYKVDYPISEQLRAMGEEIGFLKGGPRDVVELHSTVLRKIRMETTMQKAQAYAEEGRVMVLQLMGYLASYYRSRSL